MLAVAHGWPSACASKAYVVFATIFHLALAAPTASIAGSTLPRACTGDCDYDGRVEIHELTTSVRIVLGEIDVGACSSLDVDPSDPGVGVPDLVWAVRQSLEGCFCGNGIVDRSDEECDGASDWRCPGDCTAGCQCLTYCFPIPGGEQCRTCGLPGQSCLSSSDRGGSPCCANASCVDIKPSLDTLIGDCETLSCERPEDCRLGSGCEDGRCCAGAGESCVPPAFGVSLEGVPFECCGDLVCRNRICS